MFGNPDTITGVLIGVACMVAGLISHRMSPNLFVGVRTPWTLQSDYVWRRTHDIARPITLAIGAIIIAVAVLRPNRVGPVSVTLLLLAAVVLSVISYRFAVEERRKNPR